MHTKIKVKRAKVTYLESNIQAPLYDIPALDCLITFLILPCNKRET